MATILMTGVTGTVISRLCTRLLEEGHTVVALVRPAKGISPRERLLSALRVNEEAKERLFVLPGDITQELAGVSQEDRRLWAGKIEKVVHGAASIKFVETADNEVFNANVLGTEHMLHLAEELGIPEFHFVSTVFVGGNTRKFQETDPLPTNGRNAYETSKIRAEALVKASSMRTAIYRLPIVVGDYTTGKISSFTGYYGCAAPFWLLRQTVLQRWNKDPSRCLKDGITVEGDWISLALNIPCSTIGPLHIAPIDWETDTLGKLVAIPAQNQVFHVVHPNPPKVKDAFMWGLEFLKFRGITCGENRIPSSLQQMIERGVGPFMPYISLDEQRFEDRRLREVLTTSCPPPILDAPFFERLLAYAIERNFGRPIQAPQTATVGN